MNTTRMENLFSEQWTWSARTILVLILCSLITILTILGQSVEPNIESEYFIINFFFSLKAMVWYYSQLNIVFMLDPIPIISL